MAQCRNCGRSAVLLRTDRKGLCAACRTEIQERVGKEKDRIKEALIYAKYLQDERDLNLHLQRALNAVRVLSRYESLGFVQMNPDSKGLAAMLQERFHQPHSEGPISAGQTNETPTEVDPRTAPGPSPGSRRTGDRRSSGRSPARLWVRLDSGLRARTEDVSPFGVRLRTVRIRQPGTRLRCRLDSPRGSITTEGVVRWAHPAARGGGHAEMGVQFPTPVLELEMYGGRP